MAIGAQWLGTDTQAALQRRAEAERRRSLDAERERVGREAEQRVARVEAEKLLLQKQARGGGRPTCSLSASQCASHFLSLLPLSPFLAHLLSSLLLPSRMR